MKRLYQIAVMVFFFSLSLSYLTSIAQCQWYSNPWYSNSFPPINININYSNYSYGYNPYSYGYPPLPSNGWINTYGSNSPQSYPSGNFTSLNGSQPYGYGQPYGLNNAINSNPYYIKTGYDPGYFTQLYGYGYERLFGLGDTNALYSNPSLLGLGYLPSLSTRNNPLYHLSEEEQESLVESLGLDNPDDLPDILFIAVELGCSPEKALEYYQSGEYKTLIEW
jgi:hypothetical protein